MYYILGWQDGSLGQDTVVRPCSHPSTHTKLTHTRKKKSMNPVLMVQWSKETSQPLVSGELQG